MRLSFIVIIVFFLCSCASDNAKDEKVNSWETYKLKGNVKKIIDSSFLFGRDIWMVYSLDDIENAIGVYDTNLLTSNQVVNFDTLGFMDVDFFLNDTSIGMFNDTEIIFYRNDSLGNWIEKITYIDESDFNNKIFFIYGRIKRTIVYY